MAYYGYEQPMMWNTHAPYGAGTSYPVPPPSPYGKGGGPYNAGPFSPYYGPPPMPPQHGGKGNFRGKGGAPPGFGPWACPFCYIENHPNRDRCFSCHGPRDGDIQKDTWREGDWFCSECKSQNFARRSECFQCGAGKPEHPEAPPLKRRRLNQSECPPTHPCIRVFGFCKTGITCPFTEFPSNACLLFLKGKCRFGERCLETHYQMEADGSIVTVQENITELMPPPPEGCHPCVRVYGFCKLGNICRFAHVPQEACLLHLKGRCRFGDNCKELHLTEEELNTLFPAPHVPMSGQ